MSKPFTKTVRNKPKKVKIMKWPTWEKELFKRISKTRCRCEICKKNIKTFKTRCFAHILAKGQYAKYRLYENNIAVVCSIACHQEVDKRVAGNKYEIEQQITKGLYINLWDYDGKHNTLLKNTKQEELNANNQGMIQDSK